MVQQHQRHPGLGARRTASTARSGSSGCSTTCRHVQAFRNVVGERGHAGAAGSRAEVQLQHPAGEPARVQEHGLGAGQPGVQTVPAYLPGDQALYTPVLDDRTGRTDQVSFGVRGIPSLGDIGQYDSSTDPLVGGNDNPYPAGYPSKPTISGEFGQDSTATTSRT